MDIARPDQARKRRRRRILLGITVVLTLALITFGVSRLKPVVGQESSKREIDLATEAQRHGENVHQLILFSVSLCLRSSRSLDGIASACVEAHTVR
jgi:hypothetical protein